MPNKGYKATARHKMNLSKAKKGKLSPLSTTHFQKGDKNARWKGGIAKSNERQKQYLRDIRRMAIASLGGKCARCSFSDERALQIDHVNGGGSLERKNRTYTGPFHKHVVNSFLKNENKYQILCANCNWIKRFENNEISRLAP